MRFLSSVVLGLIVSACGPVAGGGGATGARVPRTAPPPDLIALAPANSIVLLHADLNAVRQSPRYDWFAEQLAVELGLTAESPTLRALLDRTDDALGVMIAGGDGRQEGALLFSGEYASNDFDTALALAQSRHGGPGEEARGPDGRRVVMLGNATMIAFDPWTFAVVQGAQMRAHLSQVPLRGPRSFRHDLIEFGARIGLPQGSAQAWASQDTPVGADMVGLVFAGENPQMVHNFVGTVQRHLGL
jgi:hypothetical protein